MEALLLLDQSISAQYRERNRYASMSSFSFHHPGIDSGNPNLSNHTYNAKDSIFGNPPSLSSFSSFPSLKPPLLPLPLARNPSLPSNIRGLSPSPSPNHRKNKKNKDQGFAPKKPKSTTKKDSSRLNPDPANLSKEAPKVLRSSSSSSSSLESHESVDIEFHHSGSIFSLAPHPSSLPLPRFSLRPKPGCNAEAGQGVEPGATDDLRRLLRLPQPVMKTGSSSGDS